MFIIIVNIYNSQKVNCDHELTDADVEPAVIEHTPLIGKSMFKCIQLVLVSQTC